ncbi:MAG: hypothetical protein KDD62_11600, partial [Bdellovibrionales bacterium]|nr:hypothetical protein [Bdellovibrionales bacterium]
FKSPLSLIVYIDSAKRALLSELQSLGVSNPESIFLPQAQGPINYIQELSEKLGLNSEIEGGIFDVCSKDPEIYLPIRALSLLSTLEDKQLRSQAVHIAATEICWILRGEIWTTGSNFTPESHQMFFGDLKGNKYSWAEIKGLAEDGDEANISQLHEMLADTIEQEIYMRALSKTSSTRFVTLDPAALDIGMPVSISPAGDRKLSNDLNPVDRVYGHSKGVKGSGPSIEIAGMSQLKTSKPVGYDKALFRTPNNSNAYGVQIRRYIMRLEDTLTRMVSEISSKSPLKSTAEVLYSNLQIAGVRSSAKIKAEQGSRVYFQSPLSFVGFIGAVESYYFRNAAKTCEYRNLGTNPIKSPRKVLAILTDVFSGDRYLNALKDKLGDHFKSVEFPLVSGSSFLGAKSLEEKSDLAFLALLEAAQTLYGGPYSLVKEVFHEVLPGKVFCTIDGLIVKGDDILAGIDWDRVKTLNNSESPFYVGSVTGYYNSLASKYGPAISGEAKQCLNRLSNGDPDQKSQDSLENQAFSKQGSLIGQPILSVWLPGKCTFTQISSLIEHRFKLSAKYLLNDLTPNPRFESNALDILSQYSYSIYGKWQSTPEVRQAQREHIIKLRD